MRRLLIALPAALLVVGLLPLAVLAGVPEADAQSVSTNEDTAKSIVLTASESSGVDVTGFHARQPDPRLAERAGLHRVRRHDA